jgi:DNA-binding MarR family transcriptional regulator
MLREDNMPAPPAEVFSAAEIAHLVLRVERTIAMRLATILADDCSVDRWCALLLLADGRGHAMSELIAHTLLPPTTVTRLVVGMIGGNLAFRRVDEADRRRVLVYATERGHELHARLGTRIEKARDQLFRGGLRDLDLQSLARIDAALHS